MSERLHDYEHFQSELHRWVREQNDPCVTRCWRILRGCVTVHAMVDSDGDMAEAFRAAWQDVYEAFSGLSCTFVMEALVQDMLLASGGVGPPLLAVVDEAFEAAAKPLARKKARTARLRVVEGGEG